MISCTKYHQGVYITKILATQLRSFRIIVQYSNQNFYNQLLEKYEKYGHKTFVKIVKVLLYIFKLHINFKNVFRYIYTWLK